MKIATRDFRNYVQYERALCRMTFTQMIAYTDFVSRHCILRALKILCKDVQYDITSCKFSKHNHCKEYSSLKLASMPIMFPKAIYHTLDQPMLHH